MSRHQPKLNAPFPALLADAAWEMHGDQRPALGAVLLDQLHQLVIFLDKSQADVKG